MTSNTCLGYIVSEILVKNLKLLILIVHGMEALLYKNKTYPSRYILSPYTAQILHAVINKMEYLEYRIMTGTLLFYLNIGISSENKA